MRIRNILSASLAFGLPVSINLLSIVVFTRELSLHDYGKLSLAWISIEFARGVFFTWCKMGMMRFFDRSQRSIVIGIQFCMIVSLILLSGLVVLYVLGREGGEYNKNILSLIIIGVIGRGVAFFIQDVQRILYKRLTRYTFAAVFTSFSYYVPAIFTVLWLEPDAGIGTILSIQTIGLLLFIVIISVKPLWLFRKQLFKRQKAATYQWFFKYGIPVGIGAISAGMFTRIDRYVIESVLGFKELGIYSAAFSLSNLAISSIFTVLTLSTYPEIIRLLNAERCDEAKAIYKQNGNLIFTLVPLCVFLAVLLNDRLCEIFFGTKGTEVAVVFPFVLAATYLFNLRIHYFDQIFQFTKTTQNGMNLSLGLGITHLLVGYWMAKGGGLPGIAVSSAVMSIAGIIIIYFFSLKRFEIRMSPRILILNGIASILFTVYLIKQY